MAAPAQAPPQQPAASEAAAEAALAAEVAAVLAQAAMVSGAASALLIPVFRKAGIPRQAVIIAIDTVMAMPPDQLGMTGPATRTVSYLNLMRRAQFVVASAKRVAADLRDARAHGTPLRQVLADAIVRERRYYGQHLYAIWNRMDAASRVDSASMLYGRLLGWNTVRDNRTSPECRHADRHNFYADVMPDIGYPGMVHPHCRCWPGRPFAGAPMLPSRGRLLRRLIAA